MPRSHLRGFTAVIAFASLACGGSGGGLSSPTQSTPALTSSAPLNLSGTWSGPASDSSGPGQMTWKITQEGASFSGALTMIDMSTSLSGRGSVSGAVSGSSIQFSIRVPVAGFDSPYASCSTDVSGDGQASTLSITGAYSGSNSCGGAIASGQLTLSKQ